MASGVSRPSLTDAHLRTPRAAALAGIVFSTLLLVSVVLLRISVPTEPGASEEWLWMHANRLRLALNLVPFAGVAFLWFIGVLRDRLGEREDRFFATVFLGSGFLFLAMLFMAAAVATALLISYGQGPSAVIPSTTFTLARSLTHGIMSVYAVKAAAVFMITTSTITIFTGIAARWIAYLGYGAALFLLVGSGFTDWTFTAFPLWILLLSGHVLFENLRSRSDMPEPDRR